MKTRFPAADAVNDLHASRLRDLPYDTQREIMMTHYISLYEKDAKKKKGCRINFETSDTPASRIPRLKAVLGYVIQHYTRYRLNDVVKLTDYEGNLVISFRGNRVGGAEHVVSTNNVQPFIDAWKYLGEDQVFIEII